MKTFDWLLVHFVAGFWLVMSPYIFEFTDRPGAYWNAVIVGLAVIVGSGAGLHRSRERSEEISVPSH